MLFFKKHQSTHLSNSQTHITSVLAKYQVFTPNPRVNRLPKCHGYETKLAEVKFVPDLFSETIALHKKKWFESG